jgi:peptidoglycan/xylan/chitin deacetylase (PgdA/CDA1 family)
MDNMGEAADIQRNLWPAAEPIGNHYSVTSVLPKLLDLLDQYSITTTYFIESWNLSVYPSAVKSISDRGHEVAWHAFQHEAWSMLSEDAEQGNFETSMDAMRLSGLGLKYEGFRPPGGLVNEPTLGLMRRYGLQYLSPAAERAGVADGISILPFRWKGVDAYYYMDAFAGLREMKGGPRQVMTTDELVNSYVADIDDAIESRGFVSLLFHPFLTNSQGRVDAVETVLKHVQAKKDELWVAPGREVAEWVSRHADEFGNDPGWDRSSWR